MVSFPKVNQWINKEKKPTVKQLEEFSRKVHVPFGYLLLDEPPEERIPFPFFRTKATQTNTVDLNVYETIQILKGRQDWLVDYLKDNEYPPLPFVGKYSLSDDFRTIVQDIRNVLNITPDWARKISSWYNALNYLTERIESQRVIISFNGVVGNNNHRKIPVSSCRGFVLINQMAPFLFVNSQDSKSAQIFTLIHELAHIWLGESAGFDLNDFAPANDPLELLCNEIAAEFLTPENLFLEDWENTPDFIKLSRKFKVSPIVIARRALHFNRIDKAYFFSFYNEYVKELQNLNKKKSDGGNPLATMKKRISYTFAEYVNEALNHGAILHREAYKLTGLRGGTYDKFFEKFQD